MSPRPVAVAVECAADVSGQQLIGLLDLPPPRATVVLNGTAAHLEPPLAGRLADVLGAEGLAGTVEAEGLTVVTGGTDAGIFGVLGRALDVPSAPLIGVAPRRLVTWPAGPPEPGREPLEPHHSHFVLVDDGDAWGYETPVLLALARALGARAPSVAVICGGGPVTRQETEGHLRDRRPVVVLAGSGRFADDLADSVDGTGLVTVCPLAAGPHALANAVLGALWPGRFDPEGSG